MVDGTTHITKDGLQCLLKVMCSDVIEKSAFIMCTMLRRLQSQRTNPPSFKNRHVTIQYISKDYVYNLKDIDSSLGCQDFRGFLGIASQKPGQGSGVVYTPAVTALGRRGHVLENSGLSLVRKELEDSLGYMTAVTTQVSWSSNT